MSEMPSMIPTREAASTKFRPFVSSGEWDYLLNLTWEWCFCNNFMGLWEDKSSAFPVKKGWVWEWRHEEFKRELFQSVCWRDGPACRNWVMSSTGSTGLNKIPWPRSQPVSVRKANWLSVSTPSAMVFSPRFWARDMIA